MQDGISEIKGEGSIGYEAFAASQVAGLVNRPFEASTRPE